MAIAGDKVWKGIFKHIQELDEGEDLDTEEKVRNMLINLKISPDLGPDLQDMLCDQLNQHAKQELLSDVQMAGPDQSMESYRKAIVYGKTAENAHRARHRATRPEIAENMSQL